MSLSASTVSIILVMCSVMSSPLFAQPFYDWATPQGSSEEDVIEDVDWTAEGGLLSIGTYEASFSYSNPAHQFVNRGSSDVFLLKQNNEGLTEWVKTFGSTGDDLGYDITQDSIGNIYITGSFSDSMYVANDTLISRGGTDAFIIKLDSLGEYIWHFQLGGTANDDGTQTILERDGNLIFAFHYRFTAYFDNDGGLDSIISNGLRDSGIMKLSPEGDPIWVVKQGNDAVNDRIAALQVDSLNRIFVFGQFKGEVDFDASVNEHILNSNALDSYLLTLSSEGEFIRVQKYGGGSEDAPESMVIQDGVILLTGRFKYDFDAQAMGGDYILEYVYSWDVYFVCLNIDGSFNWAGQVGDINSDIGYAVDFDREGNIYLAGLYAGEMDLDMSDSTHPTQHGTVGRKGLFISKYSANGEFVWAQDFTGTGDAFIRKMEINELGEIALAGKYDGVIDMNPDEPGGNMSTGFLHNDYFTAKYVQCYNSSGTEALTSCGPIEWNGITFSSSGEYIEVLENATGCDSVVTLEVTILESYEQQLALTDCDSIVVNGQSYFTSGEFEQVHQTAQGCDSVFYLDLSIDQSTFSSFEFDECLPFTVNGVLYQESGQFEQVTINEAGCDSVIALDVSFASLNAEIEQTEEGLTVTTGFDTYQWLDCENGSGAIDGAVFEEYSPEVDGNYAILVETGACTDTSDCYFFFTNGLSDYSFNDNLSICPNPTADITFLKWANEQIIAYHVYDQFGKLLPVEHGLNQYSELQIDLSDLPAANYFILVDSASGHKSMVRVLKN